MNIQKLLSVFSAIIMLSACGKGVHLSKKPEEKNALTQNAGGDKKDGDKTQRKLPEDKGNNTLSSAYDGELRNFSIYDYSQPLPAPFTNAQDTNSAHRTVGQPAFMSSGEANAVGLVKASNLAFRAVLAVPSLQSVNEVTKFELELVGVRRYLAPGSKDQGLQNQILCIAESKICSGQKDESNSANLNPAFWGDGKAKIVSSVFSEAKLGEPVGLADEGSYVEGNVTIDLIKAFGLEGKNAAEIMQFIQDQTTEFAKPNYRKFRFFIANNTYFDSGKLVLVTNSLEGREAVQALVNGTDDEKSTSFSPPAMIAADSPNTATDDVTTNPPTTSGDDDVNQDDVVPPAVDAPATTGDLMSLINSGKVLGAMVDMTLPGSGHLVLQGGKMITELSTLIEGQPFCNLIAVDADGKPLSTDLTVKTGTELSYLMAMSAWKGALGVILKGTDGNYYTLRCAPAYSLAAAKDQSFTGTISLEQFQAIINGILEIRDPAPAVVVATEPVVGDAPVENPAQTTVALFLDGYALEFPLNSRKLNKNAKDLLCSVSEVLNRSASAISHIQLRGTTDRAGYNANYNLQLSHDRAKVVRDQLVENGITAPMDYVGEGAVEKSACGTDKCAKDRAVKIEITVSSEEEAVKIRTELNALFNK